MSSFDERIEEAAAMFENTLIADKSIGEDGVVVYEYGDRYSDPNRKDMRKKANIHQTNRKGKHIMAEMYENHHEMARRIILGQTNVEIATALGCSPQTVSNVRNQPIVKEKLAILNGARDAHTMDIAKQIMELAPIALERVKEALTNGKVLGKEVSASGILQQANTLIDREIGKPTQTINTRNVHAHLTQEQIEEIKARAFSMAKESGQA